MLANWKDAIELCKNLKYAGYNDWRLPTIYELKTIQRYRIKDIDLFVFDNIQPSWYWSSTINSNYTDIAWYINMDSNYIGSSYKTVSRYIWPVRGGKFDHLENLIINNLEENQPLFTDNNDGTVTDNRTGLMWLKDADYNFGE